MRAWTSVRGVARHLRARWEERERRPHIVTPQFGTGPTPAPVVLMPVGRRFDQRKPDAMVQCREGYLNAFAAAGIQGRLIDWRDLAAAVMGLVAENVALISCGLAATAGVSRVVFGGATLPGNDLLRALLAGVTAALGREPILLDKGAHAGAVGALGAVEHPSPA